MTEDSLPKTAPIKVKVTYELNTGGKGSVTTDGEAPFLTVLNALDATSQVKLTLQSVNVTRQGNDNYHVRVKFLNEEGKIVEGNAEGLGIMEAFIDAYMKKETHFTRFEIMDI